jgi:hypothetical protein
VSFSATTEVVPFPGFRFEARSVVPRPSQKCAKDGAPSMFVVPESCLAWEIKSLATCPAQDAAAEA